MSRESYEAKLDAKAKGREKVRDGDFTTACAQTCPTGALIFGSLLDPDSRVSKLINDVRAYQVLAHLNTKPAVIYLKRVTQKITGLIKVLEGPARWGRQFPMG